ncbi:phage upper tail fiber protein [Thiococcus pfennigii]|uniref:phage upper tail fiber protein n=1 Tax=Thiococcus pfennigii TaxID=1057 RepID=UPI001907F76D|nr:hypothetical protein [Thiococcus pfennigii]MBK1699748.1 hypothetical protein [Thiococcus pfennigii]
MRRPLLAALQPGDPIASLAETGAAKILTADERSAIALAVLSNTTGIAGADRVTNIVSLTQAEYDAIAEPDGATLYVITD